jgi:hypothetical protein
LKRITELSVHTLAEVFVMRSLLLWLLTLIPAVALTQTEDGPDIFMPMEFVNQDVHDVLGTMFEKVHIPYVLGAGVKGRLSLRFPAMRILFAIEEVLDACDLTYTVRDGVYRVMVRPHKLGASIAHCEAPPKAAIGDTLMPKLRVRSKEIGSVLMDLFRSANSYFISASDVHGRLSFFLPPQTLESRVTAICMASGLTWRSERQIYRIIQREEETVPSAVGFELAQVRAL